MKQYFKEEVRIIVESNLCEFKVNIDFALNLREGDVLFPVESGNIAKWVIDSDHIEQLDGECVKINERFICDDHIMIFAKLA